MEWPANLGQQFWPSEMTLAILTVHLTSSLYDGFQGNWLKYSQAVGLPSSLRMLLCIIVIVIISTSPSKLPIVLQFYSSSGDLFYFKCWLKLSLHYILSTV